MLRNALAHSWQKIARRSHLLGGLTHEHEALSVRDNLRRVQSLLKVVDELLLVALEGLLLGTGEDFARPCTLCLDGGQATGEDSLTDERDWDRS